MGKKTSASKLELIGKQAEEIDRLRREGEELKKDCLSLEREREGLVANQEEELEHQWGCRAAAVLALIRTMTWNIGVEFGAVPKIRAQIDSVLRDLPKTMRVREDP